MARATYGSIITTLKGSIGGLTFQKNLSGNIVRLRPWRKKYNTPRQMTRHQIFLKRLHEWHLLSLGNQQLWNAFAALHTFTDPFGNLETLTGLNWYCSINTNLEMISESITPTPPAWNQPTPSPTILLILSPTDITLHCPYPSPSAYNSIIISLTQPISNTSYKINGKFRQIKILNSGPWTDQVLTTEWNNYFNLNYATLAASGNFKLACEVFCISNTSGLASPVNRDIQQITPITDGIGYWIIETDFIVQ
ncbi:MAG TPA: hypothetical protein VMR41_05485 [Patescibacteria group bacterium]|nr:hypothetical protein [Patescibacteria group bacterium]